MLLNGTREALLIGNETDFSNAYLQYAGQMASNVGVNDGGHRADVLRRVIMGTATLNQGGGVGQNELSILGSRLQSSGSIARSDIMLKTACIRMLRVENLELGLSGSSPLVVTAKNNSQIEALSVFFYSTDKYNSI